MKVVLLRVGVDTGAGGTHGPLFADGSFEFIPIPDGFGFDQRTYGNTPGRHGRLLVEYFRPSRQGAMARQSMHIDPEFETYTYGDPTRLKSGLHKLQPGDLLVFYSGLQGWGFRSAPALYVVGYFEVLVAGKAAGFSDEDRQTLFSENFHVRHRAVYKDQRDRLVLVKGSPSSRLLEKATRISEVGQTRSGRLLHVLSEEMQAVFGGFNGHVSIQRSPPRWVAADFVDRAAAFVRSLE